MLPFFQQASLTFAQKFYVLTEVVQKEKTNLYRRVQQREAGTCKNNPGRNK